jgi:hypothetical protein
VLAGEPVRVRVPVLVAVPEPVALRVALFVGLPLGVGAVEEVAALVELREVVRDCVGVGKGTYCHDSWYVKPRLVLAPDATATTY